jgi:L-threonylcarbamoyladenylate synthase
LESHYSPTAEIFLNREAGKGDGLIALSRFPTPLGVIRLASPNTLEQFASDLYGAFRYADRQGLKKIFVITPEGNGLAAAIRDRLDKASNG